MKPILREGRHNTFNSNKKLIFRYNDHKDVEEILSEINGETITLKTAKYSYRDNGSVSSIIEKDSTTIMKYDNDNWITSIIVFKNNKDKDIIKSSKMYDRKLDSKGRVIEYKQDIIFGNETIIHNKSNMCISITYDDEELSCTRIEFIKFYYYNSDKQRFTTKKKKTIYKDQIDGKIEYKTESITDICDNYMIINDSEDHYFYKDDKINKVKTILNHTSCINGENINSKKESNEILYEYNEDGLLIKTSYSNGDYDEYIYDNLDI